MLNVFRSFSTSQSFSGFRMVVVQKTSPSGSVIVSTQEGVTFSVKDLQETYQEGDSLMIATPYNDLSNPFVIRKVSQKNPQQVNYVIHTDQG